MAHGHATWPASSTEANWACSGRLALIDGLPETTSEAADWGTCCHTIGEQCLRDPIRQAVDYVGSTIKGKQFEFEVDEEMADTAQVYVDYVRALVVDGAALQVEQRFSLDALKPPFDAGGTADAVVYKPKLRNLEVVDLKGGRGVVVAATGNKQLRTYALGAALANPALQFDTVTVTIVQPRADHRDGRIRERALRLLEALADALQHRRRLRGAGDFEGDLHAEDLSSLSTSRGSACRATGRRPARCRSRGPRPCRLCRRRRRRRRR